MRFNWNKRQATVDLAWDSSSDDSWAPPTTSSTTNDPTPIYQQPLAPRSPWMQVVDLHFPPDKNPTSVCDTGCKGNRPGACVTLNPQCPTTESDPPPDDWQQLAHFQMQRQPMVAGESKDIAIYWLITPKPGRYLKPETDYANRPFNLWFKSTTNGSATPNPSFTLFQDFAGNWIIPNNQIVNPPQTGWGTTNTVNEGQKLQLTDKYLDRINDNDWHYSFSWVSNGNQRINYFVTKHYDPLVHVPEFKTITLPSDCMYYGDRKNHAPTTKLVGALGGWHTGATEAFWDSNRFPPDKTITIDLRDIPEWSPTNHHNVQVLACNFVAGGVQTSTVSLTLTNNTDQDLTFFLNRPGVGSFTNTVINAGEEGTIAGTWTETHPSAIYRRANPELTWFSNSPATGFISLTSFTTQIPNEIERKEYSPRELIVRAWRLDPTTQVLTNVPVNTLFDSSSHKSFDSSAFANRDGFGNKYIIVECNLWLHNFAHFGGGGILTTTPPVNLAIDGSVRISISLNALKGQLTSTTDTESYANPYDEDAGKNGIVTVGNYGVGAPSLVDTQKIVWYMSRDFTYDNTLRVSRVVTLN